MIITLDASELAEVKKAFTEISGQMPKVFAKGMTDAAYDAKREVSALMPRVLDRPTPWTKRSLLVLEAEKTDKPIRAAVLFKWDETLNKRNIGWNMLDNTFAPSSIRSQVYAVSRDKKATEKRLLQSGITSPARPFMVPAKGAKLDRYGNVTTAFMNKVLYRGVSGGSASGSPLDGGRSQSTTRSGQYFVMKKNGQAVGIYQNKGKKKAPLPVFNFVKSTRYKKRLPFHETVNTTVASKLDPRITAAMVAALQKYWSKRA